MTTFEIKEEFLIDNQPMKLISGAIHYFRMTPAQWEDSLYNLKALGANTVETYIPWNIHEPQKGTFDFSGRHDVVSFVRLAQKMGLYVILRPSVYICAEWEFGGLPAWLLQNKQLRLRSTDPIFMQYVYDYFSVLLPKLLPLQITQGGPVLMMQVENEYGSYGMEKEYLRQTKAIMEQLGVEVPLFTSDGSWDEVLDAGTLIEEDVFVTGNFGSHSKENSAVLADFMARHGKKWPIMCMEYWDGWFNRWGEPIITRDPAELAQDVKEMLKIGSLNLYMFHGGTNFGFYNGCSARGTTDLPQITSYDYDALLTESGEPTAKYYAVQQAIKEVCPEVQQAAPRTKKLQHLGVFPVTNSVSLFATLDAIAPKIQSTYPQTMEEAGTGYGYMLYSLTLKNYRHETKIKLVEVSDRAQLYVDRQYQTTQYREAIGEEVLISGKEEQETIALDILVENMGRVNYGFKLNNPTQSKGIRGGVIHDIHFHQGYTQSSLNLDAEQIAAIDFTKEADPTQPSFYEVDFTLAEVCDTYIDCRQYGKGIISVNGHLLGRYWNQGPTYTLYCPKEFLITGKNKVVIFETEGSEINELVFSDHALTAKQIEVEA
ncbi:MULTISPECIES: glycoside hydrolase family 35 protein [Enterococcus]|uniref:Beta-galactosidase n=1 Tax=Enterococcus sulfureus ATCC 49903 TaxID=1140003 RepID=S0PB77_9ENTE|nr:beta-galactosidase family protein [Enterococcus sulfureus]EOT48623.1 beta-galactosidase [Enterococcus sulfureus ATCC 49903]EOT87515.1 beta-galactosidase [Enterococcus sulfureus ATCC 49903]